MKKGISSLLFISALCAGVSSAAEDSAKAETAAPVEPVFYGYRVINTYPHDATAFTQGLFFDDGTLFESTGHYGQSVLRKADLTSGATLASTPLANTYFGEGSVAWGEKIIMLTWRSGDGLIFDRDTLEQTGSFTFSGEGWGLTHNGDELIMSDGTSQLRFLDPETQEEKRRLTVTLRGKPLTMLNELEWINGEIFANVWQTNAIARIDPKSGVVTGIIDMRGLLTEDEQRAGANWLNGIAYDAESEKLFVTGKYWPKLFEVELTPR